ncbi:MAG: hypothetical protein ACF8R9_06640 [Phycisphaerales bacterium JB054]
MAGSDRIRSLACIVGVVATALAMAPPAGFAQTAATFTQAPADDWRAGSEAYALLRSLAASEDDAAGEALPVPDLPGADAGRVVETIGPDDAGWDAAQLSLDAALEELSNPKPEWVVNVPPPAEPGPRLRAQRLYVSGMAKRTAGDNAGAAADFAAAAQLDPGAAAPWLRLAESQARTGQGPASILSRRRAADLGDNDPVSLFILGSQTARLGQHDLAAHYFARCVRQRTSSIDAMLEPVAKVRLAESLRELGYLRGAVEALQGGLPAVTSSFGRSAFGGDAAELASRAAELWLAAGDMASRIGDERSADEAYARAAEFDQGDSRSMFGRRAAALLREGKAAAVGLLVIDDAARRGGYISDSQRRLLRSIKGETEAAAATARALQDLVDALPEETPASIVSGALLARASLVPNADVRAVLTERGMEWLDSASVLDALFGAEPEQADRVALAIELIAAEPGLARSVANALERWHAQPGRVVASLPESDAGRLLRAAMLVGFGHAAEAGALGLEPDAEHPALAEVLGRAGAMAGDWGRVDRVVAALASHPLERARVLYAAQRFEEAGGVLAPLLEETTSVPTLLLGAELALAEGAPARAEELFARAVGVDPFDERGYDGLVSIYQGFGDARRAAEAVRLLRDRLPEAWALGWIDAQDDVRRGLIDEAEARLRALIERSPDRPESIDLLSQIWTQRAQSGGAESLADALAWTDAQTSGLPASAALWALRGRVLSLAGSNEEAERLLRDSLEARPAVSLSRALERVLREAGRPDEAERVAESRFASAGPGIEASLDRAEALARGRAWTEIAPVLRDSMPLGATLLPRQKSRVLALISALSSQNDVRLSAASREALLSLLDLAQERDVGLSWQLHSVRWTLLLSDPDASDAALFDAARAFMDAVDTVEAARSMTAGAAMPDPVPMQTVDEGRGCVAYLLANALQGEGRETASLDVFRLALEYYPDHAWAANDLGYFLVERHERLDEAEMLLERAYRLKPAQASIADSLAWLRYKTGQFDDATRPDGSTAPGAVTLLRAAVVLPGGESNPTIHDHLGDALWRSGDRERALSSWIRAQQLLFDRLVTLRDGGRSAARDRLTAQAGLVAAKIDAARAGQQPDLPPLYEGP